MSRIEVQIEESWKQLLHDEFEQPYFDNLRQFLKQEKAAGQVIYPPGPQIFNAFNLTPFPRVKAVIIGQDPYHGPGQAHGLCFSVADGIPPPPSLINIFKELKNDLAIPVSTSGNLTKWAEQGVLLLNALLTVRANQPASHHGKGWEIFTDAVIRTISEKSAGVVFLLWGKFAQEKQALIDSSKHHILKAAHPSPFSATNFYGCRHFSKTNSLLISGGKTPIDWQIV
ncbi:MAG: uracil-DNA glycosylase [Chitinophagales bacterium]|nr:uracil-DNA glycosylase [Chitinophagales bacterium]